MISKIIKEIRYDYNLSQQDLGKLLKVSQQVIFKWENNLCLPNSNSLIKLYKHFGITPNEALEIKNIKINIIDRNIINHYNNFHKKIALLRKKKKLTQKKLGKYLNITQRKISYWETGKVEPSIEDLKNISIFFNIDLNWLLK